jgi:hypothetical protein
MSWSRPPAARLRAKSAVLERRTPLRRHDAREHGSARFPTQGDGHAGGCAWGSP